MSYLEDVRSRSDMASWDSVHELVLGHGLDLDFDHDLELVDGGCSWGHRLASLRNRNSDLRGGGCRVVADVVVAAAVVVVVAERSTWLGFRCMFSLNRTLRHLQKQAHSKSPKPDDLTLKIYT